MFRGSVRGSGERDGPSPTLLFHGPGASQTRQELGNIVITNDVLYQLSYCGLEVECDTRQSREAAERLSVPEPRGGASSVKLTQGRGALTDQRSETPARTEDGSDALPAHNFAESV